MTEKKKFNQIEYQNDYIRKKYDRLTLALPQGKKLEIETQAKRKGFRSLTAYLLYLAENDK